MKKRKRNSQVAQVTEQNALLWLDHDDAIAYRAIFARMYGVSAGVMLSQACYWQRRVLKDPEQWWYKNEAEWMSELGFNSRKAVANARRILVDAGVLEFKLEGMPRRAYYRVNLKTLAQQIANYLNQRSPVVSDGYSKLRPMGTSSCIHQAQQDVSISDSKLYPSGTALITETTRDLNKDFDKEGAPCVNLRSTPSHDDSWQSAGELLSHINLNSESPAIDCTAEIHAFRQTYGFEPPTDPLSLTKLRYCLQPDADEKVRARYLKDLRQRAQEVGCAS